MPMDHQAIARLIAAGTPLGEAGGTIVEAFPDPFFIKDRERRFLIVNSAFAKRFERSKSDVIGRTNEELFEGDVLAHLEQSDLRVMTSGETICVEEIVPDHAGHLRTYSTTKSPLHHKGQIVGLIGYAQEITQRERDREKLKIALRAARMCTWHWDLNEGVEWSPELYSLYGIDPGTTPAYERWLESVVDEDRERLNAQLEKAILEREEEWYSEFRISSSRKGARWLAVHGTIYYSADGEPIRMSGVSYDITTRKEAELARNEALLAARRAERSKGRFLAAASHDLRQPLQAALFHAASLRARLEGVNFKKAVQLEETLQTLQGLTNSLFEISQLETGAVDIRLENLWLDDLIDEVSTGLSALAEEKGLTLRRVPTGVWVRSDRTMLERILSNIVQNAIKYTSVGYVEIKGRIAGSGFQLEVQDTGIGITRRDLDRIWDEFYQVGNKERDRTRGLGLGLSIVQRLSDILGHSVTVNSEPGQGSTFQVMMPLGEPEASTRGPETGREPASGGLTVIIDDDPLVLGALSTVVRDWGFHALSAANFDAARRLLENSAHAPQLLIADYRLPRTSGIAAIGRIRKRFGAQIPAILITGDNSAAVTKRARRHGIRPLLKPVTPERLYAELIEAMREGTAGPDDQIGSD